MDEILASGSFAVRVDTDSLRNQRTLAVVIFRRIEKSFEINRIIQECLVNWTKMKMQRRRICVSMKRDPLGMLINGLYSLLLSIINYGKRNN